MADPWKPTANHDTKHYWAGCERRELVLARCEECRQWIHPPRGVCPRCWSDRIAHEAISGRGRVYSFVVLPAARQGPDAQDKVTVWAELEEQERLIVVADLAPSERGFEIMIGDRLELTWGEHRGAAVPNFRKETR